MAFYTWGGQQTGRCWKWGWGEARWTNVIKPEVCVITSISYDHMDVLGDTLAKIAGEKAGIIKAGSDVVSAPQFPEAMEVIERVSGRRESG
jgi:dihydrofolate synthase/folylpolyglutamate synthase